MVSQSLWENQQCQTLFICREFLCGLLNIQTCSITSLGFYTYQQFLLAGLYGALLSEAWCTAGNASHQDSILTRCVFYSGKASLKDTPHHILDWNIFGKKKIASSPAAKGSVTYSWPFFHCLHVILIKNMKTYQCLGSLTFGRHYFFHLCDFDTEIAFVGDFILYFEKFQKLQILIQATLILVGKQMATNCWSAMMS